MIYSCVFGLQKDEIEIYCFGKCKKIIFGGLDDKELGPLTVCKEDDCPFEDGRTPPIGETHGEEICIRKLQERE